MPTPHHAYAAVAHVLGGIDPADGEAVTMFYRRSFLEYPEPVRALIADFLVAQTAPPSGAALSALTIAVAGRVDERPKIEAPVWDSRFGAAMTYEQAEAEITAGSSRSGMLEVSSRRFGSPS